VLTSDGDFASTDALNISCLSSSGARGKKDEVSTWSCLHVDLSFVFGGSVVPDNVLFKFNHVNKMMVDAAGSITYSRQTISLERCAQGANLSVRPATS
jgi:hypothetical protein